MKPITIREIVVNSDSPNKLFIPITISRGLKIAETKALVDCGAEGMFIDPSVVKKGVEKKLKKPIKVKNVDGTRNKNNKGWITHYTEVEYSIKGREMKNKFFITGLGSIKMILGMPWLQKRDPIINWRKLQLTLPDGEEGEIERIIERWKMNQLQKTNEQDHERVLGYLGKEVNI